ncbi:acyl-CoA synthetase [Nocardioides gansuensis]|uniref:Acyl-CoA synthetase n=2 Tax=Nocardioides gansuensis TaxID=2138300 RepID=A0A2T8F7F9_9ACTN|nr:AMP-binding protein [Nocardioides gansuensis]PVG81654.1 acyl-CoA synthetase [Nocardioides gansuensis]
MTHPDAHLAGRSSTHNDLVLNALRAWSTRTAFIDGERRFTYGQTSDLIARFMRVMTEYGVTRGSAVGILSPNRPEAWMVAMAAQFLGAHSVGMHARASVEDHVFECKDADVRLLVVDESYGSVASDLSDAGVERVLSIGPADFGHDLLALAENAGSSELRLAADVDENTVVEILYTGGTTGRSKGVVQTQRARAAITLASPLAYELPLHPVYVAAAPITHAAAHFLAPTLIRGGTVVTLNGFRPDEFIDAVNRHHGSLSFLVPTMIYRLLDAGLDLSMPSLERIVYGAAPMAPSRLIEGHERLGRVFTQIYGQTESLALGTALWSDEHDLDRPDRLLSCGRAVPGTWVELLDDEGLPVPAGNVGEICIRSAGVMLRYHNLPDLTAEALAGGWLHTGDMARRDDEGYITIVDRRKDFIISGGFNVYTREVEDVLTADPSVAYAAVIGVPDPDWGEAVKAVIVPAPGAEVDPERLIARVRSAKGAVHAPKSIDVVPELPLTPVGKTDKKALRATFWTDHERSVN